MNTFAVAVSATLPMASATSALPKPLARASASIRALLGYRHPALAFTTALSSVGLRNRVVVSVVAASGPGIGIASRQIAKPVAPGAGTIAIASPSMAQYIGRM